MTCNLFSDTQGFGNRIRRTKALIVHQRCNCNCSKFRRTLGKLGRDTFCRLDPHSACTSDACHGSRRSWTSSHIVHIRNLLQLKKIRRWRVFENRKTGAKRKFFLIQESKKFLFFDLNDKKAVQVSIPLKERKKFSLILILIPNSFHQVFSFFQNVPAPFLCVIPLGKLFSQNFFTNLMLHFKSIW